MAIMQKTDRGDLVYLPEGKFEISIDKESLMKAVQFWFDEKVLKRPCTVVDLTQVKDLGQYVSSFTIRLDVHAGEEDNEEL